MADEGRPSLVWAHSPDTHRIRLAQVALSTRAHFVNRRDGPRTGPRTPPLPLHRGQDTTAAERPWRECHSRSWCPSSSHCRRSQSLQECGSAMRGWARRSEGRPRHHVRWHRRATEGGPSHSVRSGRPIGICPRMHHLGIAVRAVGNIAMVTRVPCSRMRPGHNPSGGSRP